MSDSNDPFQQFLNPNYGSGIFRRRIRLQGTNGAVFAELEDTNHGFRARVSHDGERVTAVEAETLRAPLNTCVGAIEPIKALVGTPLASTPQRIARSVSPRSNCTHLYDLTLLAIAHGLRGETTRQYDMEVDDEVGEDPAQSRAFLDGEQVLAWHARDWLITDGVHTGKPLYKGFSFWALEAFSGVQREAAFALQKAYFVSQARRYNMEGMAGTSANDKTAMVGVCYSYSSPQLEQALRTADNVRDFTHTPELLLKFV